MPTTTDNTIKRKLFGRVFLLICMVLLILDMPLTTYIDNQYSADLYKQDIKNTADIVYLYMHNPQLVKTADPTFLRALQNKRTTLSFSSTAKYKTKLRYPNCHRHCQWSYKIIYNSLQINSIKRPHLILTLSYYITSANKWLNFQYKKRKYPLFATLFIIIELAIIFISITFLLSIYQFSKAWHRIRQLYEKLGLPSLRSSTPFFGPTVIKESVYLMEIMAKKIDYLINEKVQTIASLSHDIKTPLTRAQFYLQKIDDSQTQVQLQTQIDEINYYLTETLSYAKQDFIDEPKRKLDIISLTKTMCEEMNDAGQTVIFQSEINRFALYAQRMGLTRALRNLIDNGIKYGQSVTVNITHETPAVKITIDDQGPGLPEAMLQKVFEPFFRYHKNGNSKASGTGLGLVIAKSIIENNNGSISLVNHEAGGLRVVLHLWNLNEEANDHAEI